MTFHLLFLGTPDFAVPTLKKIIKTFPQFKISVISMPDKVRGRGKRVSFSDVKSFGVDHSIPVYTPVDKVALSRQINVLSPDLIVVVAFGMIIEKVIVDRYFCINVHASLLPKYRGASPIQTVLLNEENETGITIIKLNEFMDAGDILAQQSIKISPSFNHGSLEKKLADLGADLCASFIKNQFLKDRVVAVKQNDFEASYCHKISKESLIVDRSMSNHDILSRIRAFSPKPGVVYIQDKKRIKLLEASLIDQKLHLIKIQPEGKPPMLYRDYLLGHAEGIDLHGN